jgi:beta-mannanase
LYATLILMQWSLMSQSGRHWTDYYPGSDVVDVLGWDVYNLGNTSGKYTSPATLIDPVIAASRSVGKPFGVAELGAKLAPSDSGAGRAAWLTGVVTQLRKADALWIEYFDADKANAGRFDWRLRDAASQSAWRQFCST